MNLPTEGNRCLKLVRVKGKDTGFLKVNFYLFYENFLK